MQSAAKTTTSNQQSSLTRMLTDNKLVNYFRWLYMQYLLNTALYMLEPFEVRLFNFVMILILVTWAYSTYVFLPSQIMRFIESFSNDTVQVYIQSLILLFVLIYCGFIPLDFKNFRILLKFIIIYPCNLLLLSLILSFFNNKNQLINLFFKYLDFSNFINEINFYLFFWVIKIF